MRAADYRSARTIDVGWNDEKTDPFRLRVLSWTDSSSVNRLAADLTGVAGYLSRLRHGSLKRTLAHDRARRGESRESDGQREQRLV